MIEILKDLGDYYDHLDIGEGNKSDSNRKIIVYLTTPKPEESQCPLCLEIWLEFKQHYNSFHTPTLEDMQILKENFLEMEDIESVAAINDWLKWPTNGIASEPKPKKIKSEEESGPEDVEDVEEE